MEADRVRGILPPSELVPLPGVREGLLGVATLKGQTVAVLDLCHKLGLSRGSPGPKPKLVIVEVAAGAEVAPGAEVAADVKGTAGTELSAGVKAAAGAGTASRNRSYMAGFMVDRVCDVVAYRPRDLRKGVLHGEGRPRKLIDFDRLVTEEDLAGLWSLSP